TTVTFARGRVPTSDDRVDEVRNRDRPRKRGRWYRRQTLSPVFHGVVQCVAIGDIDQVTAAPKRGERPKLFGARLTAATLKQKTQRSLNQFGHCFSLARGFLAESRHHGVVDVQSCFRMENHIDYMAVCQLHVVVFPGSVEPDRTIDALEELLSRHCVRRALSRSRAATRHTAHHTRCRTACGRTAAHGIARGSISDGLMLHKQAP